MGVRTFANGLVLIWASGLLQLNGATVHVWQHSTDPTPPYTNWATAAHDIQSAVDVSTDGDIILVTNGVYSTGSRTNTRVVINRSVTVRGVNGPAVTYIVGAESINGGNGEGALRCVSLHMEAVLSGFTLTNGHTRVGFRSDWTYEDFEFLPNGGGAVAKQGAVITNCVIDSNSAENAGGGVRGGTLQHCRISNNTATVGGGAHGSTLVDCQITGNLAEKGGGMSFGSGASDCIFKNNSGGALYAFSDLFNVRGFVTNCIFYGNSGGWAIWGHWDIYNSTVTGNVGGGVSGDDDVAYANIYNSIVYSNGGENYCNAHISHSCTTPLPPGIGNFDDDPGFLDAANDDFRLRRDSPCIDAGQEFTPPLRWDIMGTPRPLDGNGDGTAAIDIGAHEFDLRSVVPTNWLLSYGLDPEDHHVLSRDPDQDSHTTFQEWLTERDPTDPQSFFRIEAITSGAEKTIYFFGPSNRIYSLFSSETLINHHWRKVAGQTINPASEGLHSLLDTNARTQNFYRVEVRY